MEAAALAAVSHPAAEDSQAAVSAAEAAEAGSDLSSGSWQQGVPLVAVARMTVKSCLGEGSGS